VVEPKLIVALSPHASGSWTTAKIMWTVVLALLPAFGVGVYVFGPAVLTTTLVAVGTAVLSEWIIYTLFFKNGGVRQARGYTPLTNRTSVLDGSAALTGLLLAFNVPASIPLWQVAIGAFFAIVVGKMVFGGLGHNPFNPALAGRAFLLASFPTTMTVFPTPFAWMQTADVTSSATALGMVKEGVMQGKTVPDLIAGAPSHLQLFLGGIGGSLGEISAIALLIGALVLLITKIISWEVPFFFLAGLAGLTGIMWLVDPLHYMDPLYHLLSGGAILAAFFMLTDMVTSPMSFGGRIVYALAAGLLTAAIRLFGSYPEGASYAILIMNALVPLIDKGMPPARFGYGKVKSRSNA